MAVDLRDLTPAEWAFVVVLVLLAMAGIYYLYTLCCGYRCLPLETAACEGGEPHFLVYVTGPEKDELAKLAKHTGPPPPCHGIPSYPAKYSVNGYKVDGTPATNVQLGRAVAKIIYRNNPEHIRRFGPRLGRMPREWLLGQWRGLLGNRVQRAAAGLGEARGDDRWTAAEPPPPPAEPRAPLPEQNLRYLGEWPEGDSSEEDDPGPAPPPRKRSRVIAD